MKNEISAAEAAIQLNETYKVMQWKHDLIKLQVLMLKGNSNHLEEATKAWLSLI